MKRIIVLVLALCAVAVSAVFSDNKDNPYCLLPSCPRGNHTLCKYPHSGAVKRCGNVLRRGIDEAEKNAILKAYDNKLIWDNELVLIAQRWADQCLYEEKTCSHIERFEVRQRVSFKDSNSPTEGPSLYSLITSWVDEDKELANDENRIGCASIRTFDDNNEYLYVVCHYGMERTPVEA